MGIHLPNTLELAHHLHSLTTVCAHYLQVVAPIVTSKLVVLEHAFRVQMGNLLGSPDHSRRLALATMIAGVAAITSANGEEHGPDQLLQLIDEWWSKQDVMYHEIADADSMQDWFDRLPEASRKQIFMPQEGHTCDCCCSDERITGLTDPVSGEPEVLLKIPGSGILSALELQEGCNPFQQSFIASTAAWNIKHGVSEVSFHDGCGAGDIVFKEYLAWLKERNKSLFDAWQAKGVQVFLGEWTAAVVAEMNRQLTLREKKANVTMRHITTKDMDGPREIHVGRSIVITDFLNFNPRGPLPQAYVEFTGGPDEDIRSALTSFAALASIAFGDHSFGKKFSKKRDEQFIVCCVVGSSERGQKLRAAIAEQVRCMPADMQEKIRIEVIVANPRDHAMDVAKD